MLMLAVACVRCVECDPTYATSTATPNGNSRCTSNEYCCTRGDRAFWSMIERLCPMPVRSPNVLPVGLASPPGNGLLRKLAGVALPSLLATYVEVAVYPGGLYGVPMANCGAQYMP